MKKKLLIIVILLTSLSSHAEMQWLGDVDSDGDVDVKDLTLLIRVVNKTDKTPNIITAWDVNEDGNLDQKDIQILAKIIVKGYENKKVWIPITVDMDEKGSFDVKGRPTDKI